MLALYLFKNILEEISFSKVFQRRLKFFNTKFEVKNVDRETVFSITGPMSILACVHSEFFIEKNGEKVKLKP